MLAAGVAAPLSSRQLLARHVCAPLQPAHLPPHARPGPPTADSGPLLQPGCLPPSITRLCIVPAPVPPGVPPGGVMAAELPEQVLALPLGYLDVSESLFRGAHLAAALPRLTRLTSLALDKCELAGGRLGGGCAAQRRGRSVPRPAAWPQRACSSWA